MTTPTSADIRTGEYPVIYVGGPMPAPTGKTLGVGVTAGDKLYHLLGFKFNDGASTIDITTSDNEQYTSEVPGRSEGKGTIDILASKPGTDTTLDDMLSARLDDTPIEVYFYNDRRKDTSVDFVRAWKCYFTSDYNSGGQKGPATQTLTIWRVDDAPAVTLTTTP